MAFPVKTPAKLPMRIHQAGEHLIVRCIAPAQMDWSAPFFRDAVPASPQAHAIDAFSAWQDRQPACDPDYSDLALIFHVSRCGSTLLARNVAATGQAIVLSEPPFFSALHGRHDAIPTQEEALRISLLLLEPWRRWAKGQGKRLVLKLSSELNPFMPLLCESMPGAHRVALYREPLPVLESLDRKRMARLQHEAASMAPGLVGERDRGENDPYLIAAVNRYVASLRAMSLARDDLGLVAYQHLAAQYPQVLAGLGLNPGSAPDWSGTINAKARGEAINRPYQPVPPEQLERFARAHAPLLAIAATSYERFCASLHAHSIKNANCQEAK